MSRDIYLVIGGSGLLGRAIVEKLVSRGDSVSVMDVVKRYDDVPFYSGDVSNEQDVLDALKTSGATCVFHTASPHASTASKEAFYKVNVDGTRCILKAVQTAGARKFVYTSSSGVVFNGTKDIEGVDETYPCAEWQISPYMDTKVIAEKETLAANGKNGLLTCALRPSGIFGPGDRQTIASMYRSFMDNKNVQVGHNTNRTDWTYVTNVADAHVLAADKLVSDTKLTAAGEIFYITNDEPQPFWNFYYGVHNRLDEYYPGKRQPGKKPFIISRNIAIILACLMEFGAWLTRKKEPPMLTRFNVNFMCMSRWYNIDKAKRILGYKPAISIEEGLDRSIEWWMSEVKREEDAKTK